MKDILRKGLFFILLGASVAAFAGDVGMINELGDGGSYSSQAPQAGVSEPHFFSSFVHVDVGRFYRQLQEDSGLLCLDSATVYGAACGEAQSWKNGKKATLWGAGVGFRYNDRFALDFTYWNLSKQSTAQLADSSENLALDTWLVSALYQAKFEAMSNFFVLPQAGLVYVVNTAKRGLGAAPVHTRSINWRPAMGLALLVEFSARVAVDVSGVYVPESGRSPFRRMRYPGIFMTTAGLRYSF